MSFRGLLAVASSAALLVTGCVNPTHRGFTSKPSGFHILVDQGSPSTANVYYALLDSTLGGPFGTVDETLAYMGYGELKATDVQLLSSQVLMDFSLLSQQVANPEPFQAAYPTPFAADDVVASRFFAPKVSDVSGLTSPRTYGWRKVVRLRARTGSGAENHGVDTMYLLFNHFITESDLAAGKDPFRAESVNNQVILVEKAGSAKAWWLVYGPLSAGGTRIGALKASFDAPRLNDPTAEYFVPDACAHCHGGGKPRLNFLDTDHWFDRSTDADFDKVSQSALPVLFDGGKDETSAEFHAAFDTVRSLNGAIEAQNSAADSGTTSFQTQAIATWNQLHPAGSDQHESIFNRSIGSPSWDASNANDAALLPQLNRLCYRCHGTIKYDIFDRARVKSLAESGFPQALLSKATTSKFRMPQDRLLSASEIKALQDLFDSLADE